MEVNTKKRAVTADAFRRKEISNSYGSTNCIRFEGMISARRGAPLCLYVGKDTTKRRQKQVIGEIKNVLLFFRLKSMDFGQKNKRT